MESKFSKSSFRKVSQEVLNFQLNTLYPVRVQKDVPRVTLLFLNHDRNLSTFLTVRYLFEHGRVADIYTLSRSMFESIVSMALMAKGLIQDDTERYHDFQFVEICRTYDHLKRLGLEAFSGVSSSEAELAHTRRDDYIRKWAGNTTSWTGRSLAENVSLVDRNYEPTCNENHFYEYLYCQVYRKGSQSAHSSFAGLSKGVEVESLLLSGPMVGRRFKSHEGHLVFSSFHSLLIFLSSVRFLGYFLDNREAEEYFHRLARYIISDD